MKVACRRRGCAQPSVQRALTGSSRPGSACGAETTTLAPSMARRAAIASPMPRLAPVTARSSLQGPLGLMQSSLMGRLQMLGNRPKARAPGGDARPLRGAGGASLGHAFLTESRRSLRPAASPWWRASSTRPPWRRPGRALEDLSAAGCLFRRPERIRSSPRASSRACGSSLPVLGAEPGAGLSGPDRRGRAVPRDHARSTATRSSSGPSTRAPSTTTSTTTATMRTTPSWCRAPTS